MTLSSTLQSRASVIDIGARPSRETVVVVSSPAGPNLHQWRDAQASHPVTSWCRPTRLILLLLHTGRRKTAKSMHASKHACQQGCGCAVGTEWHAAMLSPE